MFRVEEIEGWDGEGRKAEKLGVEGRRVLSEQRQQWVNDNKISGQSELG